jgi:hypothetical protein
MNLHVVGQGILMIGMGMMMNQPRSGWGGIRVESKLGSVMLLPGILLVAVGLVPDLMESTAFIVVGGCVLGGILIAASANYVIHWRTGFKRATSEASRLESAVSNGSQLSPSPKSD